VCELLDRVSAAEIEGTDSIVIALAIRVPSPGKILVGELVVAKGNWDAGVFALYAARMMSEPPH
jgi:hypothetical protein